MCVSQTENIEKKKAKIQYENKIEDENNGTMRELPKMYSASNITNIAILNDS